MSFSVDDASGLMRRELTSGVGALVAGRRLFDQTNGRGDNHCAAAPGLDVTHRAPPQNAAERCPRTRFSGSVQYGCCGGRGRLPVTSSSPSADITQQALNLGPVDELCISQVPVLFGDGIRYFSGMVGDHVTPDDPVGTWAPGRCISGTRCGADTPAASRSQSLSSNVAHAK
jgi:hypothetical protein